MLQCLKTGRKSIQVDTDGQCTITVTTIIATTARSGLVCAAPLTTTSVAKTSGSVMVVPSSVIPNSSMVVVSSISVLPLELSPLPSTVSSRETDVGTRLTSSDKPSEDVGKVRAEELYCCSTRSKMSPCGYSVESQSWSFARK